MTIFLLGTAVLNIVYLSTCIKLYRLHLRPDPVSSPNARLVAVIFSYLKDDALAFLAGIWTTSHDSTPDLCVLEDNGGRSARQSGSTGGTGCGSGCRCRVRKQGRGEREAEGEREQWWASAGAGNAAVGAGAGRSAGEQERSGAASIMQYHSQFCTVWHYVASCSIVQYRNG
ncbi:hypothetical protein DFH08DRAFT_967836 [Mycena albidolilacea]|uniref:Uncharacterized protein n=1 Tax=Mycena albidolilacea TaxID=1033008 RepID=A0AAD6ZL96_9AGAR|nr:hypothetical protein DFH08DRAFT_967836 [Mycena albidolilacea]